MSLALSTLYAIRAEAVQEQELAEEAIMEILADERLEQAQADLDDWYVEKC